MAWYRVLRAIWLNDNVVYSNSLLQLSDLSQQRINRLVESKSIEEINIPEVVLVGSLEQYLDYLFDIGVFTIEDFWQKSASELAVALHISEDEALSLKVSLQDGYFAPKGCNC